MFLLASYHGSSSLRTKDFTSCCTAYRIHPCAAWKDRGTSSSVFLRHNVERDHQVFDSATPPCCISTKHESVVDEGKVQFGGPGFPANRRPSSAGVEAEGGDTRPPATPPPRECVGAHDVPRVGEQVQDAHQQVIGEAADEVVGIEDR
jgi:hypothetical protein